MELKFPVLNTGTKWKTNPLTVNSNFTPVFAEEQNTQLQQEADLHIKYSIFVDNLLEWALDKDWVIKQRLQRPFIQQKKKEKKNVIINIWSRYPPLSILCMCLHLFVGLRPRRTLRTVLWTAEEQGGVGAQQYFNLHKVLSAVTVPISRKQALSQCYSSCPKSRKGHNCEKAV